MEKFEKNKPEERKQMKAQITVLMSLMMLLLLSFAAAILESASIQTAKNIRRADVERAVESVFAEYQKELLEEYDVFGLDGTYETGNYSEERVIERLCVFGAVVGEGKINAVRFLSDNDGEEFAYQVSRYMENRFGIDIIKDLAGEEERAAEQEREAKEYQYKEEELEKEMEDILVSQGELTEENGEETENPLEILQNLRGKVLTEIALPGDRPVSRKSVEGMEGISQREKREGKGEVPSEEKNLSEKLYLIAYIPEHFGSYIQDLEDRPLVYEQEYLIGGKNDDMDNLRIVLYKIRRLRMAPNYLYLQSDETKKAEAKVLAGVVSVLMGNPELTEVITQGILMAWAYGESVMDIRTLTAGGKVPAVKTKETWKLSLSGLMKLGTEEDSGDSENGENGFGYEEYLKILFLLESQESLQMRMLDLIEWNMKVRLECPFFQADACITKMRTESTCRLRRGITYHFYTYYAYQ